MCQTYSQPPNHTEMETKRKKLQNWEFQPPTPPHPTPQCSAYGGLLGKRESLSLCKKICLRACMYPTEELVPTRMALRPSHPSIWPCIFNGHSTGRKATPLAANRAGGINLMELDTEKLVQPLNDLLWELVGGERQENMMCKTINLIYLLLSPPYLVLSALSSSLNTMLLTCWAGRWLKTSCLPPA